MSLFIHEDAAHAATEVGAEDADGFGFFRGFGWVMLITFGGVAFGCTLAALAS